MTRSPETLTPAPPRVRVAEAILSAVLVVLLGLTAARSTLAESSFRASPLKEAGALSGPEGFAQMTHFSPELTGLWLGWAILACAAGWAMATALRRSESFHRPMLATWLMLLTICLLVSADLATNRRDAFNRTFEQATLILAGVLVAQLADTPSRRRLVLAVLGALAVLHGLAGLGQLYVEIPERIANFEANRITSLTQMGIEPGSAKAQMFETRIRERTVTGWFGLANVQGSMLILLMLAAAGVTADKLLAWRRQQRGGAPADRKPGEIPLPLAGAIFFALATAPVVWAWLNTDSAGALLFGLIAAAGFALVAWRRRVFARRRRLWIGLGFAAVAIGLGALVTVGLVRGRMPVKTLQVRWDYWQASARMVAHYPLEGVGPGNFPEHYLIHRNAGAEEAVKNPHNVIAHALAEFGLLGGGVFLTLLGGALVAAMGPTRAAPAPVANAVRPSAWPMLAGVLLVAGVSRVGVHDYPNALAATMDNLLPLGLLAIGLALAGWATGLLGLVGEPRFARIAIPAGCVGFVLHNLTDFALFQPGAAMVFWVAMGLALAMAVGRPWRLHPIVAGAIGLVLLGLLAWTGQGLLGPVSRRIAGTRQIAGQIAAGRLGRDVVDAPHRAVMADPLDAALPGALAEMLLGRTIAAESTVARRAMIDAGLTYAELARDRDPLHVGYAETYYRLRLFDLGLDVMGDTPPAQPGRELAELANEIVRVIVPLDPQNPHLLLRVAELTYRCRRPDLAERLVELALQADGALTPESLMHLTPAQQELAQSILTAARAWQAESDSAGAANAPATSTAPGAYEEVR